MISIQPILLCKQHLQVTSSSRLSIQRVPLKHLNVSKIWVSELLMSRQHWMSSSLSVSSDESVGIVQNVKKSQHYQVMTSSSSVMARLNHSQNVVPVVMSVDIRATEDVWEFTKSFKSQKKCVMLSVQEKMIQKFVLSLRSHDFSQSPKTLEQKSSSV